MVIRWCLADAGVVCHLSFIHMYMFLLPCCLGHLISQGMCKLSKHFVETYLQICFYHLETLKLDYWKKKIEIIMISEKLEDGVVGFFFLKKDNNKSKL